MAPKSPKRLPKFLPMPAPPQPGLLEMPDEFEVRMKVHAEQAAVTAWHNVDLFFGYFEIKKTGDPAVDYLSLAICLAEKLARGFHSQRKRGAPAIDAFTLVRLNEDVQRVKRDKRRLKLPDSDRQVADALAGRGHWKGYSRKTLQNLLPAARDPKIQMFVESLQAFPELRFGPLRTKNSKCPENSPSNSRDTFLID
jgi:hypothetical protein